MNGKVWREVASAGVSLLAIAGGMYISLRMAGEDPLAKWMYKRRMQAPPEPNVQRQTWLKARVAEGTLGGPLDGATAEGIDNAN